MVNALTVPPWLLHLSIVLPLIFVLFAAPLDAAPASNGSVLDVFSGLQRPGMGLSPRTEIRLLGADSTGSAPAAIQRWTTHEAPSFSIYARPATEADVQTIVSVSDLRGELQKSNPITTYVRFG
jgi:hypothetical protein